jgi:hypothetical protein
MDLYAPTRPSTSAIAARSTGLRALPIATGEGGGVIGLKAGEGGIEHFSARHEDDIEPGRRFLSPKQLPGKTLGPVSHNGGAKLSSGRYTESTPTAAVWRDKQRHEPACQAKAAFIRPLEFRAPANPFVPSEALRHGALNRVTVRPKRSDAFCPSYGVASARSGHSLWTSGRESRVSCCGDAYLAETCASPLPL